MFAGYAHKAAATPTSPSGPSREYKVKAALLLNFLKYASFPKGTFPTDTSPVTVLIVGKDPFGSSLRKSLASKGVGKRPLKILHAASIPLDLKAHLVFTSGLSRGDEKTLIERLKSKPCLLVGESPGFARDGGFINLYLDGSKVRFEINRDRTTTTRIKLKAEILKLARIIETQSTQGSR